MTTATKPFAEWLVARLAERGVTQGQVAAYVGVEDSTVARWKSGRRRPTVANCYALARYFRRPVQEVLRLNDYPTEGDDGLAEMDFDAQVARATDLFEEGLELLRELRDRHPRRAPVGQS